MIRPSSRNRLHWLPFFLVVLICCSGSTCSPPPAPPPSEINPGAVLIGPSSEANAAPTSTAQSDLVNLINNYRQQFGASALSVNSTVQNVAQQHSVAEQAAGVQAHVLGGTNPRQRLANAGIYVPPWAESEVLAQSYDNANDLYNALTSNATFQPILINAYWNQIGIGLAGPGNYWTIVFIRDPS